MVSFASACTLQFHFEKGYPKFFGTVNLVSSRRRSLAPPLPASCSLLIGILIRERVQHSILARSGFLLSWVATAGERKCLGRKHSYRTFSGRKIQMSMYTLETKLGTIATIT